MPDYMFLLESRLSPEQRAVMLRVQELSAAMGFNLYLTGGTVRDLITGASLRDLDFTVEGNPSKVARELEISEQTYCRWRNQYGGMMADDAKELRRLRGENGRLKRVVADLTLDNQMLKEVARRNF